MTERFFQKYLRSYQPFKSYWNYEDGCVLLGCIRMFEATGAAVYAEFVLDYLSQRVNAEGVITNYLTEQHNLDSFNSSKALFFAEHLTGDERFRKAIRWQAAQLPAHPRTPSGMIWHKGIYPQQVWIDGVYMAAPFYADYAVRSGKHEIFREIARWFRFLHQNLRDAGSGLYYHALDEAKQQPWANPQTGLSASHWLRGEGWFLMAVTDTVALLPDSEDVLRAELGEMLAEALGALSPWAAENGLYYQVIDRPELAGNYTETSGSLMVAYAMMQGAVLHLLPTDAFAEGAALLDAVIQEKFRRTEQGFQLCDICSAAGLGGTARRDGSPTYYLSEPKSVNDPKAVGVLMMANAIKKSALRGAGCGISQDSPAAGRQ